MAAVKFKKFVTALPSTLEPNTMYFVRVGGGFDLYVTNNLGFVAAYPLNQNTSTQDQAPPYFIPSGETFNISSNRQALVHLDVEVAGFLNIDGVMVEV